MSDVPLAERKNFILVGVGRKGCGKSTLIREVYVPSMPRILTLDTTGEGRESYPKAIEARGLVATLDTIRDVHSASGGRAWHVIAAMDRREFIRLVDLLAPPYQSGRPSLSAALGGICIDCSEIQNYAPARGMTPEIENAIASARHHKLSWITATQQPQQCAVLLRSQADEIVSFGIHEPNALEWLGQVGGVAYSRVVHELPQHWYALYDTTSGAITVFDNQRRQRFRRGGVGQRAVSLAELERRPDAPARKGAADPAAEGPGPSGNGSRPGKVAKGRRPR